MRIMHSMNNHAYDPSLRSTVYLPSCHHVELEAFSVCTSLTCDLVMFFTSRDRMNITQSQCSKVSTRLGVRRCGACLFDHIRRGPSYLAIQGI
jgi:hypothetical protein